MSQKLTLDYPVTIDGKTYSDLAIRRPKLIDVMIADKQKSDYEKEVTLLSNLCGVSPNVINEMDLKDYESLREIYASFKKQSLV
jgi:hypothetical protein